jgi:hypothetical protein
MCGCGWKWKVTIAECDGQICLENRATRPRRDDGSAYAYAYVSWRKKMLMLVLALLLNEN